MGGRMRDVRQAFEKMPEWEDDFDLLVAPLYLTPAPELMPGEVRVLASFASLSRGWWSPPGDGMLWLTDRRLLYRRATWSWRLFGVKHIELPRNEIVAVQARSRLRSLLANPFLDSFEVKAADGRTYVIQAMKVPRWIEELSKTSPDASTSEPTRN